MPAPAGLPSPRIRGGMLSGRRLVSTSIVYRRVAQELPAARSAPNADRARRPDIAVPYALKPLRRRDLRRLWTLLCCGDTAAGRHTPPQRWTVNWVPTAVQLF